MSSDVQRRSIHSSVQRMSALADGELLDSSASVNLHDVSKGKRKP
jgi:hypothetical protein